MADVTFDAASCAKADSQSSLSFSHTVAVQDNRVLLVVVATSWEHATGVKYGGVAMTLHYSGVLYPAYLTVWKLVAPATGANTVAVTQPSATDIVASALSFYNVAQDNDAMFETGSSTSTAETNPTYTLAVDAETTSMMVDAVGWDSSGSITGRGSGQTERTEDNTSVPGLVLSGTTTKQGTGASFNMTGAAADSALVAWAAALQAPQPVTVAPDAAGAGSGASIGAVDDGNITIQNPIASAASGATAPSITTVNPIEADMIIYRRGV